jgi:hypothetical protein
MDFLFPILQALGAITLVFVLATAILLLIVRSVTPAVGPGGAGGYLAGWGTSRAAVFVNTYWKELLLPPLAVAGLLLVCWLTFTTMYPRYALFGGPTWALIFIAGLLGLALLIPQKPIRSLMISVIAVIFGTAVMWALVPALLGYCAPSDHECLRKEAVEVAVKEEQQRQRQAAAQQAIEVSQQPVAPGCNLYRRPHRYPASKPAAFDNPGGKCAVALFIKGYCVYFTQNNDDRTAGMICVNNDNEIAVRDMRNNPIDMPEDVDRVWSVSAAFYGDIGLWQPRHTKLLSWR